MATRAAAFTVKIRSLYDYQLRLLHGIMPPPSGFDIANTVKYFSQTLLTVLKDVPSSPLEMLKNPEMDPLRMALYPNLDYKGLYNSLVPFIEVAPLIQNGLDEFGLAILQCLGCLMPFLDHDLIDNLPFLTASCIAVFPPSLHQEIVNSLCFYILPFTIPRKSDKDQGNSVCQSLSSVIMMLFQYSDDSAHHCQLLECLMGLRSSILRDLLCVVAHGAAEARAHAAKLLFYYWPAFNANLFDKRCLLSKFASNFVPFVCQRDMCPNAGNAEAAKVCYDHCISITFASDSPPPLYLCIECANEIHREHPNQRFFDILHMMQQVSMICENKNCRSTDKSAYSICFSTECASYNGNHPIRYCQQCHNNRHNNRRGGDHITHKSLPPIWSMDVEMQSYMVEAIVSLLKEAQHHIRTKEVPSDTKSMYNVAQTENFTSSDRQSLGRYGVWLLVGRCTPEKDTPAHVLGRLLSMLFHWFHATVSSVDVFSGQMESSLEKLKNEYVHAWLQDVCSSHYKVFISCLLPHPPEYARVGGHWDTLASRTSHIKDGLNRLYCLIPYKVLTPAMWDYIMPYWMEAIVNDVPEKDLQELKSILSVIFLVDITPLKFDAKRLYHFIALRFEKTTAKVQEQALHWLQVLTILEITLPLSLLFLMFGNGVRVMTMGIPNEISNEKVIVKTTNDTEHEVQRSSITPVQEGDSGNTSLSDDEIPTSRNTEFETDIEHNLSCCILMLDILLNQMELQDIDKHGGINTTLCRDVCRLLKSMVCAAWISSHKCPSESKSECAYCESSVIWHQLSLRLIEYLSPTQSAHPPDVYIEDIADEVHSHKSPPEGDKKDSKSDVVINMSISDSVPGVLVHMPHVCSIMTATVETVSEQLDLAAIIPAEKVVSAVARAITLSETDVATATVQVAKPQVVDENEQPVDDDLDDYWQTSVGKFRFNIEDLPQDLQYIFQVLKELPKSDKPDLLYYMLQCLNILVLNGDAFSKAVKCHFGFFIWCQENLLIKNLWDLCNAENSHMCEVCVPLLLHCVTLPGGSDVFWTIIQEDFHNPDWRVRFVAVERVTVIARFMDSTPLRGILPLQAALANAFCYLISSIDDSNVYIAQRATLYLGTIHDRAIKALILCLEAQFDSVIVDRPMVLQSLYQLHNTLSDRRILTWEFFLNRFDALFLEAQINLEKSGDIPYLRDLRNTDLNSEIFIRKLHRAHEALSQSDGTGASSLKTLSASFGTKWPYKRTMSAPASFIPRQDTKQDGHIHSLNSADDGNLVRFLHRAIDFEEADQETMHLLIFLLMQFLSRTDQAYPMEEKPQAKTQTIVLHHLYLLLGYNQNERAFYMPPRRLRASPVFNAFLSNLPQLLDQNHLMGLLLLPPVLILLQFCPCPHQQTGTSEHQQQPSYSLWFLEPHLRHSWLMSLLVLLYKYQYNQQPDCAQLQSLVKIVLKTLDSQHHYCRRIPATVVMPASTFRSRDVSQPSLGQDEPTDLLETPPLSPMSIAGKPSKNSSAGISSDANWEKLQGSQLNKSPVSRFASSFLNSSMESQEVESELMAIPETENSNNSNHCEKGSLDEANDVCCIQDWNKLNSSNIISENSKSEKELQVANVTDKKPLWFIGCEEESLLFQTAQPLRKCIMPFSSIHLKYESLEKEKKHGFNDKKFNKERCYSLGSTGLATAIAPAIAMSKTITANSHKQALPPSKPTRQEKFSTGSLDGWSHGQKNSEVKSVRKQNKVIVTEPIVSVAVTKANVSQHVYYRQTSLQAPPVERLLPIGELVRSPVQKTTQKSFKIENDFHGSPDSPLSKMDVMTIESPDEGDSESTITSQQVSPPSISQLEIPAQERLLPIGPQSTTDNGITELVEKVREALGIINDPKYTSNKLNEMEKSNQQNSEQNNSLKETQRDTSSRSASPRRLIKQVALESPPPLHSESIDIVSCFRQYDKKAKSEGNVRNQRGIQKVGPFALGTNNKRSVRNNRPGLFDHLDLDEQNASHASYDTKQTSFRIGDDCIIERCAECGTIKEEYSDEELGLCIIVLGTFIHREPGLAAPLLPDILSIVAKVALNAMYPWQNETNIHLPGGAISVAHQFLRCVLHQLAPNGVFIQMFQTKANESTKLLFFRSVAQALLDFNELNPIVPIQLLLESLNSKKTLPLDNLPIILANMACYLECLPLDIGLGNTSPLWSTLLTQAEIFFRRIVFLLPNLDNHIPLLKIMISLLKMPGILQFKGILDPFSKVLGAAIQNQPLEYHFLVDLCYLCYRNFNKERDKLILCRMIVFEFVQALKFKTNIPDANFLLIINFILQDAGGSMPSNVMLDKYNQITPEFGPVCSTSIADCMRHHLADVLEFLADFHTLSKLKTYRKQGNVALNEDTFGGTLKSGVAQYLALELTRSNNRDNRAVARYMPWLYNAPSAIQQGQRDFIEWVGHIRLLSWLLLGSLTHTSIHGGPGAHHSTNIIVSQPIPQEAACHIADHIQVIMSGFAEQSKLSVLHMSSLFHAFILCQLWTVYLEQNLANHLPISEGYNVTMGILFDFWGKVTPCILQLVSYSKVLAEMVNLHFLSMLEALLECRSTLLSKLLPLWSPVLYSHHVQLPGNLQLRLQNCRNFKPIINPNALPSKQKQVAQNPVLLQWLQRLQFKMGQIELQSSTATQFYSV